MRMIKREHHYSHQISEFKLLVIGIVSLSLCSCSMPKNITYFRDVSDTTKVKIVEQATYYTPVIQSEDIIQVTIQTIDPGSTVSFNQQNTTNWPVSSTASGSGEAGGVSGYIVDREGYVILPLVGKVMVKGKTTDVVREDIFKKASEFFKDPVVNVRFANFKITVLGEVTKPSTYIMPNEKVTLLDAIGAAGDLTIYGKRENVLLIRESNGQKKMIRFNLNNSSLFQSPYFYLQQGDVVYVEPNKAKVASTDMVRVRNISIMATILSLVVVLATRIRF